jgi:hypothetical protein
MWCPRITFAKMLYKKSTFIHEMLCTESCNSCHVGTCSIVFFPHILYGQKMENETFGHIFLKGLAIGMYILCRTLSIIRYTKLPCQSPCQLR